MYAWLAIRWFAAVALVFLSLLCVAGNISGIIGTVARGISASVIPFIGGVSGALAFCICPIGGIWRWFWLPLLLDFGTFAMLTVMLYRRSAKRREAQANRARRGAQRLAK